MAVDAEGKLIYYDFGMCGTIPCEFMKAMKLKGVCLSTVRALIWPPSYAATVKQGLQDLFYGVYNRDPERCLEAMVKMGIYIPTGDKTAIRRTADFFLKAFSERLDLQSRQRKEQGAEYDKDFKPQRTKDEAKERRKAILSSIGEDLLLAANDQPFRYSY